LSLSINYNSPSELRAFLESRGLGMRKKFGQNFLINPNARKQILDTLELHGEENVWEIGAGLGAMTVDILERGVKLKVFEIDPGFINVLHELFYSNENFTLVEGDVFKTWPMEANKESGNLHLLGNLPYNIAASLLGDFIEKKRYFKRMVVTVQKEVAERMAAKNGTKNYSSFSVLCSSVYNVKLLNVIKGASFYPVPKIDSRIVRLDLKDNINILPEIFYPMVRNLFSARRKNIKNSLSAYITGKDKSGKPSICSAEDILRSAGISPDRRPETLGIEEFIGLSVITEEILGA